MLQQKNNFNLLLKNLNMETKATKIEIAIRETNLQFKNVNEKIMLLLREREVIQSQLDMLDILQNDKNLT